MAKLWKRFSDQLNSFQRIPNPLLDFALPERASPPAPACGGRFHLFRPRPAKPRRNKPEHTERAINQPPPERNPARRAKNESVRNYQHTSDETEVKEPAIAHGIAKRAEFFQR